MWTRSRLLAVLAFSSLAGNPLRTMLSTLGVVLGVGGIVAILALGDGMAAMVREQAGPASSPNLLMVSPRTTERVHGVAIPLDRVMFVAPEDLEALRRRLGERADVALERRAAERVAFDGTANRTALYVTSVTPAYFDIMGRPLIAGRLPGGPEQTEPGVVVATSAVASVLGIEPADLVGRIASIAGEPHEVIGVLDDSGPGRPPEVFVAFPTASTDAAASPPPTVVVRVRTASERAAVYGELRAWVREAFWPAAAFVVGGAESSQSMLASVRAIKLVGGAIAGIAIAVGAIGIMNVMLASVLERTREIGIRVAVGARRRDIFVQFLSESVVVAACGSLVGLLLGFGVAAGVTAFIRGRTAETISATLSVPSVLAIVTLAVAVGVLSGAYPARRAARLAPAEAMRYE